MQFYENAKKASKDLAKLNVKQIDEILQTCANDLKQNLDDIIKANEIDLKNARETGLKESLIDRLKLDKSRVLAMVEGIQKIANLPSPLNEYIETKELDNGLKIAKKRVAMGVIAVIYEARPNVTSDAFAMCLKAGSVVILKGGKEAINTNEAIVKVFQNTLKRLGFSQNYINYLNDTSRDATLNLMKMNKYIDLLIPRGGAGLIQSVVQNSTIPVIETGVGNCHIYVDKSADLTKAINIIKNAKTQRVSVCNALETLLIHEDIMPTLMPLIIDELKGVELRVCEVIANKFSGLKVACELDFADEFLDYILAIKCVKDLDEALEHIDKYSSKHSDAIITQDYTNARIFTNTVDSAVVYVNASTRFSDGEQFGLGAEIGISTQKLHARGPMGLKEITSYKYIVLGDGQFRQ